jgi:hypothetical protein
MGGLLLNLIGNPGFKNRRESLLATIFMTGKVAGRYGAIGV